MATGRSGPLVSGGGVGVGPSAVGEVWEYGGQCRCARVVGALGLDAVVGGGGHDGCGECGGGVVENVSDA